MTRVCDSIRAYINLHIIGQASSTAGHEDSKGFIAEEKKEFQELFLNFFFRDDLTAASLAALDWLRSADLCELHANVHCRFASPHHLSRHFDVTVQA